MKDRPALRRLRHAHHGAADLFERYLDPKFRDRVILPIGADGRPKRGTIVIDGLPTSMDAELQQYRKRSRRGRDRSSTQPLSGSRLADTGPPRLRDRAQLRPRGAGHGHGDGGRRHRGALPHHRPEPHRARQHGPAALAGPLPGLQQLDPRVLPLQPGPAEVRGHAAGARRAPGLPGAAAMRARAGRGRARSSGPTSSTATTGTPTTGIRSTPCTRSSTSPGASTRVPAPGTRT